jgi:diguanylate cyclase (GGDEF)-like protein
LIVTLPFRGGSRGGRGPIERDSERLLLESRVRMLYVTVVPAAILGLAAVSLIVATYWRTASPTMLLLWAGAVSAVMLLRGATSIAFRRQWPPGLSMIDWARVAVGAIFLSGLFWGLGGYWLVSIGSSAQNLVFCVVALGAVMVILGHVAWWPGHIAFHVPLFVLVALGFFSSSEPEGVYIGIASLVVCVFSGFIGWRLSGLIVQVMRISAEKQQLASGLELANEQLRRLSLTDALTGLHNRRHLIEAIEAALALSRTDPRPFALVLIDVDHFKSYNDSHGHPEGDICLRAVAETIQRHAASLSGVASRYGGEEFAMLLPNADLPRAWMICERLRQDIEALHGVPGSGLRQKVTASIGVAAAGRGSGLGIHELFDIADRALYAAKNGGRNRACVGQPHGSAPPSPGFIRKLAG